MNRLLIFTACGFVCLRLEAADPAKLVAPTAPLTPPAEEAPLMPTPHREWDIPDSEGAITVRPVPEPTEDLPPFLQQVEYLRAHHDDANAITYLESILNKPEISARDRARGILELSDCLHHEQRPAEELCWLKIWLQMYPARPEVGAVAYRVGALYTQMGLPSLARDSYYQALASAINQGQVQNTDDLKQYTRLTVATLWALAANEYRAGQWARALELFERYSREATTAPAITLENSSYLQADCLYQQRQTDLAQAAYEDVLTKHPFNILAPEARLRLYHLYVLKNLPAQARDELQSLIWTVRTVWPEQEAYWQQRAAETLLALHHRNSGILSPLYERSCQLTSEGKAWQKELAHYDRLAIFQAMAQTKMADATPTSLPNNPSSERADLQAMQKSIDDLSPPTIAAPTP